MASIRGQLHVESADGTFVVQPRHFLCLPGSALGRVDADTRAGWVAIAMGDDWLRALSRTEAFRCLPAPLLLPASLRMDLQMMRSLGRLLRYALPDPEDAAGDAVVAVLAAARRVQTGRVDWVARAYGRSERHRRNVVARLLRARNRILNAPSLPHDLASLAAAARYSPSHFLRSFRDVFQLTPHELLCQARLALARDLIDDGRLAICEIAASVGYESRHAFSRSFKRATGITASGYRQARQG